MPEKQNFEFGVETKKILKLMIHSLYTNKDIVVRELISNASDACDKLRYQSSYNPDILGEDKELQIKIDADEEKKILTIQDNGIGMSREDLISQLGTIARSGTESFLKELDEKNVKEVDLIGQFGVGFYSSFIIANRVEVISKKVGEEMAYVWESTGDGEYKVKKYDGDFSRGTRINLYLKDGEEEFVDKFHIKHIIKAYSDHIGFPILMKMGTRQEYEAMNSGAALWARPKNEITQEQYQDFYKYIVQMPGEPFMILHNRVEGNIQFTNLLFIPDRPTYDLYHPDRMTRVKLYVKKVFITEENIELLPKYLRFVQGIVDSDDLPLNISRENLQYNNVVTKINRALTKKILNELAKKDEEDPEGYLKFWNNFGPVLKEGLCENVVNVDELLDICKFYTSKSPNKPISIKEYVDRMKENQRDIYYIVGDSLENIENSPQVEGFKSRDIEVLYLMDHVDSFWVTVSTKYKERALKSIARADIDLDDLNPVEDDEEKDLEFEDEKAAREEKEKLKNITEQEHEKLLKLFKDTIGAKLKDVKISKKLTTSPVCLVADENAMDIKLERFLLEQKQIVTGLPKVLEINIHHPMIEKINSSLDNEGEKELNIDRIKTLYDEACIMEGEPVDNPADFARRLNKLLEK